MVGELYLEVRQTLVHDLTGHPILGSSKCLTDLLATLKHVKNIIMPCTSYLHFPIIDKVVCIEIFIFPKLGQENKFELLTSSDTIIAIIMYCFDGF